jgi:hypothetical protein
MRPEKSGSGQIPTLIRKRAASCQDAARISSPSGKRQIPHEGTRPCNRHARSGCGQ